MRYPKTVRAANAVSTDKKALATAILAEIPPRKKGRTPPNVPTIADALVELAGELSDAGHNYTAETLSDYRRVASWVSGNGSDVGPISWAPVSWSTHREACDAGMEWATFVEHVDAKRITGVDSLRRVLGKGTTRAITTGEKVTKVVDAIKSGDVSPAELRKLRSAIVEHERDEYDDGIRPAPSDFESWEPSRETQLRGAVVRHGDAVALITRFAAEGDLSTEEVQLVDAAVDVAIEFAASHSKVPS